MAANQRDTRLAFGGAVPFLTLMGTLLGGQMLARAAKAALTEIDRGNNDPWWTARVGLARFYAGHILPQVAAQRTAVIKGASTVFAFDERLL
ncbi:acyl-CoA dehydrogenase C-terminal domain-containing protein (plasmid) [Rhizobium sp. C104]|uniref:acyl-CoA dehydrogenase C-terminal domain-containing protein n=1 Tax=Rhizobium sp. C104 TaxID=2917727 RepID=UPI001EF9B5CD|nr:acyl-CoA dehydrogenase C-terminal domain-containing protein [Rhizobium sp. C104]ULJ83092.1 acyl-CoA dehydrogenase C-terminal domain-containing protein [Rhizobium sp. C104]